MDIYRWRQDHTNTTTAPGGFDHSRNRSVFSWPRTCSLKCCYRADEMGDCPSLWACRTWEIFRVPTTPPGKSWIFSLKFPAPGKPWKMHLVLESPGIYLWFNLTNMPFIYRTPCVVNKCVMCDVFLLRANRTVFLQLVMHVLQWIVLSHCIYEVGNCCLSVI